MNAFRGLIDPREIGGQVAGAFEAGMQRKRAENYKRALGDYAMDPNNEEAVSYITRENPEAGMQIMAQRREQQAKVQQAQLFQAAMAGDDNAMRQLAVANFDAWKDLRAEQKDMAKQEADLFGNAAMDILNSPREMWGQKAQAYAQQLGMQFPEIAQIAQLPPDQLEPVLRAAVAEAGTIQQLIDLEKPQYRTVAYDESVYDVNPRNAQPRVVIQPRYAADQPQLGEAAPEGITFTPIEGDAGGNAGGGF